MITLVPAYGRDYRNSSDVKKDWNEGKDFIIQDIGCRWDGKYANKADIPDDVKIRYNELRSITIIN